MSKKALIILAEGFEEMEAVTPADVLRRAGIEVTVAGLSQKITKGARGVSIQTDLLLSEYKGLPDLLILPGGLPGAAHLAESEEVLRLLKEMKGAHKLIGAICAAPALVLSKAGLLEGKKATCYPGCEKDFPSTAKFSSERVVVDGNLITSRGPGSSLEFSLGLVELLAGKEAAEDLKTQMLAK